MAWKIKDGAEKVVSEEKYLNLINAVGKSLIVDITFGSNGKNIDFLLLDDGRFVYAEGREILFTDVSPEPSFWLTVSNDHKKFLLEVSEDDLQFSEEYYTFLGDKYYAKEDLVKAIEGYSETEDGGVYYYHRHKVEEHTLEITPYKKVSGKYDQPTLDKVNEILKSNGIDFVVKGDN